MLTPGLFQRRDKCSMGCLHGMLSPKMHWLEDMHKKVTPSKHWTALKCDGILPNAMTFLCILKACTTVRVADKGKQIHDEIARQGLQQNDIVLGNVVVDMYVKCGTISKVQQVHNGLPSWDVVSWTAVIVGYVQVGHAKQAFDWFEKMQLEGILLNAMTCASVLNVCNALHQYHFRHQTTTFGAHPCTFQNNFEICSQFIDNNELDGCFVAPELWCSSPSTNNGQTAAPTNSKQKHYSN